MITLQAWMEQHPEAAVIDARPGQAAGGKWVQADPVALRALNQLSDFKVAHRGTSWLLKPAPPGWGKYGGAIPIKELDLPRQEEFLHRENHYSGVVTHKQITHWLNSRSEAFRDSILATQADHLGCPDQEVDSEHSSDEWLLDNYGQEIRAFLSTRESIHNEVDLLLEAPQEKFVIWVKEDGNWVEQGDGEMTKKTCDRIVSELRHEMGGVYKILAAGVVP